MFTFNTLRVVVFFLAVFVLACAGLFGQTKEQVKEQAESQLQQMTPTQIESKIKEYGMTRAEAEAKAKELGIDLNTYLQQQGGGQQPVAPPAKTPAETAKSEPEAELPAEPEKKEPFGPAPKGGGGLPYFGYGVFRTVPSAFEPTAVGPVDPEYIVGPGDVLRVTVWGQVEFENELTIDKEGKIFIPTVGQFIVSGLTLDQVYNKLLKQMSRSYSGLVSQPPTVWLDVTLARLRPKRIFIMGEVNNPGGYTVSSYATVFSALYSVNGPTVKGSLRDVRVVRSEKTIAHVDMYKYFTGADETNDLRVQNNDIIFVPPRGKTVAITREVLRPAIYELLPSENLRMLLQYAGGARSTAYLERVQIDRIIPFEERREGGPERRVIDVNFREILNANKDFQLEDGDRVAVFSILDDEANFVTVFGPVVRPGRFEIEKAPTVRALIDRAEGLLPVTYMPVAHLIRYNEDQITTRIIPFDLGALLAGDQEDITLNKRDQVIVYSIEATEVKNKSVTIGGEVKSPGSFPLHSNMTLDELILLAGGYTEAADLRQAEVSRIQPGGIPDDTLAIILHPALPTAFALQADRTKFDTASVAWLLAQGKFLLQHHDEVFIRTNPDFTLQRNVTVEGDFRFPGSYTLKYRGERLSDILTRAGGPTSTTYLGGAQLMRQGARVILDFEKAFYKKDKNHDVELFAGDRVIFPQHPRTVAIEGQVNNPGLVTFIEGDDVSDYIDRAGGKADSVSYALLYKPSGETERVNFGLFRADPEVPEGSRIRVLKEPPPIPEPAGEALAITIKDIFAIATSAATIAFIVYQTTK